MEGRSGSIAVTQVQSHNQMIDDIDDGKIIDIPFRNRVLVQSGDHVMDEGLVRVRLGEKKKLKLCGCMCGTIQKDK